MNLLSRNDMNIEEIKNLSGYSSYLDREITIKDYFKKLLLELLSEPGRFINRKPFSDGSWYDCIYKPLINSGLVYGEFDGSSIIYIDEETANRIIKEVIESL